ncbi:hypothetical protein glysoja_005685 [Glycine soja]|nr:hypothetical protein glysoja_005685 [Glycine soja]
MAQRRSPQPLPEPDTKGNNSHQKPQHNKETERVAESPSAAESTSLSPTDDLQGSSTALNSGAKAESKVREHLA